MRLLTCPCVALVVSVLLLASAGCGETTAPLVCQPECPAGSRCEATGCVSDNPGGSDLAVSVDASVGCSPACSGATPVCNAGGHCVACASDGDCPAGNVCRTISVLSATCVPGCNDDARCRAGGNPSLSCCAGACIDTSKDAQNCGGCGKGCAGSHSSGACVGGVCMKGACTAGWADCNGDAADGCEINVRVDQEHCGACGMTCAFANALAGCANTCYLAACKYGFDDCDGDELNGCEKSTLMDVNNCGGCGMACKALPNAKVTCANATCLIQSCTNGFGDCDVNAVNGCESNLLTDAKNCGACGKACPQGNICVGGACTCPMCNNLFPNASARCVNNQCIFDQCNLGYGNCDNNQQNGCEIYLAQDTKNCGACGNVCPQNKPVCTNSQCNNIDLSGVFSQYQGSGRNVYIWKTPMCAVLANHTNFCPSRGLAWWSPKSAQDAQALIDFAFKLDGTHTWIQVYGLQTGNSTINGYNVTVDSGGCVDYSPGGANFGAVRKWACSFCNPQSNAQQQNDGQSCCWDKGHPYDWFVCEG